MRLTSIDYVQFPNTQREWSLTGLALGPVNLIVGKNATGKTRTLNIIHALGNVLGGRQKPEFSSSVFDAKFDLDGRVLRYELEIADKKVAGESFKDGDRVLLRRKTGGEGTIFHEREKKDFDFQAPETDVAVVARRDKIQHSFLNPLNDWGIGVRHFPFGEYMGRMTLALIVPIGAGPEPWDVNAVVALFKQGEIRFPSFADAVTRDMNEIGYVIEIVGVMPPTDVAIQLPAGTQVTPSILYAKERDLPIVTQQTDMSQGMFRALALIIHANYAAIASTPSCIIVDDIGEGLDFDRSCRLIDLLRRKTLASSFQLVMATNDRFVMNQVPLEEWSVLQREGGHVRVRNYQNSKQIFDEFKFTGLSNFDFLATDFLDQISEEVGAIE